MAKRLQSFPERPEREARRYPWPEWTDGSPWEIRRGDDYDAETENMRVNLHVKADALGVKVRTTKFDDEQGEGLIFQFFDPDPDAKEAKELLATAEVTDVDAAMDLLYEDLINIYERARKEVTIPRSDGRTQKYAATRFKRQVEKGRENNELVPTVARIVRKPTLGFGHLEAADRWDLMVEALVIDECKPYHRFFTPTMIETASQRMEGHVPPSNG